MVLISFGYVCIGILWCICFFSCLVSVLGLRLVGVGGVVGLGGGIGCMFRLF